VIARAVEESRRLDGRVGVVTGGAGGIGLATAVALAREGAAVTLVDRDERGIEAAAAAVTAADNDGHGTLPLVADVRLEADMERMVERTLARFGRIDILVAAAGILRHAAPQPVAKMDVADWDAVLDTNLKGVFLSNRAVMQTMIAQRSGHIINLASTSGREGRALDAAYCASKAGVIGLSQAAAQEVNRYGVRVNTVLPGAVDTPLWEQNAPLPRPEEILPPERVADLIVYLVTLPEETILLEPVIVPFRTLRPQRS
jgi:NAD(P)-dependent dehydrogenase (short-subunit alcohol dehydrogenase family)